jgi:hypothetical protein
VLSQAGSKRASGKRRILPTRPPASAVLQALRRLLRHAERDQRRTRRDRGLVSKNTARVRGCVIADAPKVVEVVRERPLEEAVYQRDRPPQPYFKRFEDFFDTPKEINAAPVATGFDGRKGLVSKNTARVRGCVIADAPKVVEVVRERPLEEPVSQLPRPRTAVPSRRTRRSRSPPRRQARRFSCSGRRRPNRERNPPAA